MGGGIVGAAATAGGGGGGGGAGAGQHGTQQQQRQGGKNQQQQQGQQEVQQLQSLVLDWGLADRLEMLQRRGGEGEGEHQQGGVNAAPPPRLGVLWCEMCGALGKGVLRELQVTGMRWCPKQVRG